MGKARWEAFPGFFVSAKWGFRIDFRRESWDLSMFIYVNREEGLFYKWFEIRNTSDQPQIVWEYRLLETTIEVERVPKEWDPAPVRMSSGAPEDRVASLGDQGTPLFVGSLFYGAPSPLHQSHYDQEKRLFLSQYQPAEVVHPNATMTTERLVMGVVTPSDRP